MNSLYMLRLLLCVGCAVFIVDLMSESDFPLLGYSAVVVFALMLTIGNLICELWKLKIDPMFYRYVALPAYPLIIVFAAFAYFGELRLVFRPALLFSGAVYLFLVFSRQTGWLSHLGDIYRRQVVDHLLFQKDKRIVSRNDLVLTEAVVNAGVMGCAVYLAVAVFKSTLQ